MVPKGPKVTRNLTNFPKKFCEFPPWTPAKDLFSTLTETQIKETYLLLSICGRWSNNHL